MHNTKYRTKFCSQIDTRKNGVHDNNEMTNENLCGELFSVLLIHSCIKKANSSDE